MRDIKEFLPYYLGGPCVNSWFPDTHEMYNNDWKLKAIDLGNPKAYCLSNEEHDTWTENVKPILRKLESITEEEAQELLKVRFNHPWQNPIYQRHSSICIDFKFSSGPGEFSESQLDWDMLNSGSFHYLLSLGFDLFNLIDEGLAIDKKL